uniref:Uncharacterized protein n=1 Tax=Oryza rufipogon TaxID=4529 RepID=A0A0E0PJA7_ORYRU
MDLRLLTQTSKVVSISSDQGIVANQERCSDTCAAGLRLGAIRCFIVIVQNTNRVQVSVVCRANYCLPERIKATDVSTQFI